MEIPSKIYLILYVLRGRLS